MATITDNPPAGVKANLELLRNDLNDKGIPAKKLEQNLLIATWNLRAFGSLTTSWQSKAKDSPKRDWHSIACIAEIIKRFDIIAVQEVKANLKALRDLLKLLGPDYSFIMTDVNLGDVGNGERMAYIFDTRRVQLSGLACELTIPDEFKTSENNQFATKQFVRSPYAVSFKAGKKTFILVTMHLLYGDNSKDRIVELQGIANWMSTMASDVYAYDQNVILLGDFNIDERGDILYETFISRGLYVPDKLSDPKILRSIFDQSKYYDQIAWFNGANGIPQLSLEFVNGGYYPFTGVALANRTDIDKRDLSWMISDHYPLWAEFKI